MPQRHRGVSLRDRRTPQGHRTRPQRFGVRETTTCTHRQRRRHHVGRSKRVGPHRLLHSFSKSAHPLWRRRWPILLLLGRCVVHCRRHGRVNGRTTGNSHVNMQRLRRLGVIVVAKIGRARPVHDGRRSLCVRLVMGLWFAGCPVKVNSTRVGQVLENGQVRVRHIGRHRHCVVRNLC